MKIIKSIIVAVLVIALFASGYFVVKDYYTDYRENKNYEDIEKEYSSNEMGKLKFDITKLKKKNSEVVGWIYCKNVLSYPIVKGKDNSFYLHHDSLKKTNISGSIFMDYNMVKEFDEKNCIIYGHNMKDKDMFGRLRNFLERSYAKKHNIFYFYDTKNEYKYKLVSVKTTRDGTPDYQYTFNKEKDHQKWFENLNNGNTYYSSKETYAPYTITLSTCYSNDASIKLVLHLVRVIG